MLFGSDEDSKNGKLAERSYPHPFKNCIVLGLMLAEWYESKDGKQRFLTEEEAKAACGSEYVREDWKRQAASQLSKSTRDF